MSNPADTIRLGDLPVDWLADPRWDAVSAAVGDGSPETWAEIRRACQIHGLAPWLATALGPATVPRRDLEAFARWLELCRRLNVARIDKFRRRLRVVLAICAQEGVPVILLKSAALAEHYLDSPELRPISDLDLLVAPEDQPRLRAALARAGYQRLAIHERHHTYGHRADRLEPYLIGEHPDLPLAIDAHDTVRLRHLNLVAVDLTERLRAKSEATVIDGLPCRLPVADALLEHLLCDLAVDLLDGRARAVRAFDLEAVAARVTPVGWQRLAWRLGDQDAQRWAWLAIALARRLVSLPLPEAFEQSLVQATPAEFRARAAGASWAELSLCAPGRLAEQAALPWCLTTRERVALWRRMVVPWPGELPFSRRRGYCGTVVGRWRRMLGWNPR